MSEVAIRPFEPRDYEAVSHLFSALDAAHRDAVPELFRAIEGVYAFNEGARAFYEAAGYGPLLTRLSKRADQ